MVVIKYTDKSNPLTREILERALTKELGIPKDFLSWKKLQKSPCKVEKSKHIIGLCIENKDIKIYHFDEKVYKRTLKRIIQYHRLAAGVVK